VVRDKIVLFDVDNTLLYSGGAGSLAMRRAFESLHGIADGFRRVEFSGRTDWAILRDAMRVHGLLDSALDGADGFRPAMARFTAAYLPLLEAALQEVDGGRAMPGVAELLAPLSGRDARSGLATGNFRQAALLKLRHFGLDAHLPHEGGFGDDAEDRGELVAIAIERVAGDERVDPRSVWVIGDTPLDIAAAQANGARSLAVATGPCSVEALLDAGADVAVEDLSDTPAVLATLLGD